MEVAEVWLWGTHIASVATAEGQTTFQYTPEFQQSRIEVAPLTLPLGPAIYSDFDRLNRNTFHGLPGLLADSLPDKFGQALIEQWLAVQGRTMSNFSAIEQLCYVGSRGMGALEYKPQTSRAGLDESELVDIERLVALASAALEPKKSLVTSGSFSREDLTDIISVGTSAGGARAKAVIGWNAETNEVRSGQLDLPEGFDHWLLKFDGVENNKDKDRLADPVGYGRIEYAYSLMAKAAQIDMPRTRLLEEGGRAHFMIERFDRTGGAARLHYQSLNAIGHHDYNTPRSTSYEVAFQVLRQLGTPRGDIEQQFRRAVFNVIARNQDDHTKNIGFLMDKAGEWRLSPAFDVTYAYRPDSPWVSQHQMTINLKADDFERSDIHRLGETADIDTRDADAIIDEVQDAVANWQAYATTAGVPTRDQTSLERTFRLL